MSLADAQAAANNLGGAAGHALTIGANQAFIDGIQLAVTAGAILAVGAAIFVYRNLPSQAAHGTSMESPITAMEATAEVAIAGVEPAFAQSTDSVSG